MSRPCPIYGRAIYADCQECDSKWCNMKYKYNTICIGIDQSYQNTGISISADNTLLVVKSIELKKYDTNSEKRKALSKRLHSIVSKLIGKAKNIICVIERIRLRSQGFLNIDYIKSIGAINATIVDVMTDYNIKVYSVDTRCWKAQVVGTSKPKDNAFGVPSEKWPTVLWVINRGFENSILKKVEGRREKGTFVHKELGKCEYNNDASDSAAISMFWFLGDRNKLKEER